MFPAWVRQQDASPDAQRGRVFRPRDRPIEDVKPFENPVLFWVEREDVQPFGEMYEMAMAVLCIPATEAASERTFKHTKRIPPSAEQ